jgi:hypothetical protein
LERTRILAGLVTVSAGTAWWLDGADGVATAGRAVLHAAPVVLVLVGDVADQHVRHAPPPVLSHDSSVGRVGGCGLASEDRGGDGSGSGFEELTAERARSLAQAAAASVRAEGLVPEAEVEAIAEQWARGEVSTSQMRDLVRRLYGVS